MRGDAEALRDLDLLVARASARARPVPSLIPENAAAERARLVRCLSKGEMPVPAFREVSQRVDTVAYRTVDAARALAERLPAGALYQEKLEELELDFAILDAWGHPRRIRPLSARRYGTGADPVRVEDVEHRLIDVARGLLDTLPDTPPEPRDLPPDAPSGQPSVAALIARACVAVGLDVRVRVEPRLVSLAATGERTVFLAQRRFGLREACRLVAHEVFGHLVVAANARSQPLRLLEYGLAGAFADQEGVALYLEEVTGTLCSGRLRTLAGRVLATHRLHEGASFGEVACELHRGHAFEPDAAIAITERAFRGGGVARDAGYLAGWLRVRSAVQGGEADLHELRMGRVAVRHVPALRALVQEGYVRPGVYCPSLALSRRLTLGGTRPEMSPPNIAASFTMLELT